MKAVNPCYNLEKGLKLFEVSVLYLLASLYKYVSQKWTEKKVSKMHVSSSGLHNKFYIYISQTKLYMPVKP